MRVLLAADFYPPDPGGLELHVQRLAGALKDRGHDVLVVSGGQARDDDAHADWPVLRAGNVVSRVPLVHVDSAHAFHPPLPDPVFLRALSAAAASFRPEVVHSHGWCSFSAAALARRVGAASVVTLHDYGLLCPKRNLRRGDETCEKGRGLRCVTCPSTEQGTVKRTLLAATLAVTAPRMVRDESVFLAVSSYVALRHVGAGVAQDRVSVVPNFIDVDELVVSPTVPVEQCRDVLFLGGAAVHKGRQVVEEAFARLPAGGARLVIVGDEAAPSTTAPNVVHTGRLRGPSLTERFSEAAVVVVPSIWPEPCPTVALEAMAFGRPVVASDIGGLPDIVTADTGVLVPAADPAALARAIAGLLADPARRRTLGDNGASRVAAEFSNRSVVPRIEAAYEQAVRRGTRPDG